MYMTEMELVRISDRLSMCNELWLKADYVQSHYQGMKPAPISSWHEF